MNLTEPENVEKWAVETFAAVECGDRRRTARLIKVASALASNPSASLPCALETWGETLLAYRLLGNPAISYEQIMSPHWSQTYLEATQGSRTLLLADTTEMDFSTHKAVKGLAPIGNSQEDLGRERAYGTGDGSADTSPSWGVSRRNHSFASWPAIRGDEGTTQETGARRAGVGAQCETDRRGASKPPMDLCGR